MCAANVFIASSKIRNLTMTELMKNVLFYWQTQTFWKKKIINTSGLKYSLCIVLIVLIFFLESFQ